MITALNQLLDPVMDPQLLSEYGAVIFIFFYFDRRTRKLEEKLERILGFLKGVE